MIAPGPPLYLNEIHFLTDLSLGILHSMLYYIAHSYLRLGYPSLAVSRGLHSIASPIQWTTNQYWWCSETIPSMYIRLVNALRSKSTSFSIAI